jgi:CubicO group peptidase (beta-lactamase class C family)
MYQAHHLDPFAPRRAPLRRAMTCALLAGLMLLGAACGLDGLEALDELDAPEDIDGVPAGLVSPAELTPSWQHAAARADLGEDAADGPHALTLVLPSKFSAVFRGGAGHQTVVDVEWSSFAASWQTLSGQGYRLIDIDTTVRGGIRYYTGVFQPGSGGHALWVGATWASFTAKWSELSDQGLRLVDFETYLEGTTRVYTGVWRAGTDGHYLWAGVDWASFASKWSELAGQGLRLTDLEVWEDAGQLRYGGVWRAGTGAYDIVGATSESVLTGKIATLAAEGKQPIAIEYESGLEMPPPGMAAAFHDVIDGHAVGYSFAVAEAGTVTSQGGFGYARAPWEASDPSVSMTGTRRSHLASVSKPITSIALHNLLESQSTVGLDTRFLDIIGGQFSSVGAGVQNVTLRNLLQHRSGMTGWGYCGPDAGHASFLASMKDLVSKPLANSIGTYMYSNGNFCLLRMVIETLSGTGYVTYVTNSVLAPMGISGMTCKPDATRPTLYYKKDQASGAGYLWADDYSSHCAAYGWYASANDLAKLLIGVRNNTVLTASTTSTMLTQRLGWFDAATTAGTAYHHNGAWITGDGRGYNGAIIRLPGGTEAVVLINTDGFNTVGTLVDGFNRMQQY